MIEVYKILHGYYDPEAVPCLQQCIYQNTRGHIWKLYQLQSHLNCRKYSFTVRVAGQWNKLPDDVVNAPSVPSFENIVLTNIGHARSFCMTSRLIYPEDGILDATSTVKIWIYRPGGLRPVTFLCSCVQLPGVKRNISWHPSDILAYSVWPSDHVCLYYCNPR